MSQQRPVVFAGHNNYLMSVAKFCRDHNHFTDVTLKCYDGEMSAHRLILGAASSHMKHLLSAHSGDDDLVILVPETSKVVLEALLEFIYSGKMVLSRVYTRELKSLVFALGIDPSNVQLEVFVKPGNETTQLKLQSPSPPPFGDSVKTQPSRAAKRRLSTNEKDATPTRDTKSSKVQMMSTPIRSSRGRQRGRMTSIPSGVHVMSRSETWVCALCHCYDPPGADAPPTTEWIGCDCNRWYHKHCTKLEIFDDTFSCSKVNLQCLIT